MPRVLIADDSPTARALLRSILQQEPDFRIEAVAENGEEAVRLTESLRPDVVLMDVHMPLLDGIEATREIMSRRPTPIVIVSSVNQRDVDLSLAATEAGALAALPKPGSPGSARFDEQRRELVSMLRAMAGVKVVRRWSRGSAESTSEEPPPPRRRPAGGVELIALAGSTGAPAALRSLLADLPPDFDVPIVLVQHIARDFTAGFAHWLDEGCVLPVRLARSGDLLLPGKVYVAPDDQHLGVTADGRVRLSAGEPINGFRPSASCLFESAALHFGPAVVGVVLTGMGSDGADGLLAIRRAGGYVIGQDEATSVVFGMAQEAERRGAVDELLPLDRIAGRLLTLVRDARAHG